MGSKKVLKNNPKNHYDIGSRIYGFLSHLLVFTENITLIDMQLDVKISGLNFICEDATNLKSIETESIESLSSLYAIEHFGLGRYGDGIDPQVFFKVIKSMQRVIKKEGIYFSVIISKEDKLIFNAHRVFNPLTTVTTTEIETFKSVCLYMSTINPDNINSFDNSTTDDSNTFNKTIYNIYKVRWNIEVIFYQQKTFWSFSNYMVKSKAGIEKYVNLLRVAYTMYITLPFINKQFAEYKFQSPQELKYNLSECILKELFIGKLLKALQSGKIF